MVIIYVRHGKANSRNNKADPPLSPEGIQQMVQAAAWLREQGYRHDTVLKIVTSKWVRCQESARVLASELGVSEDRVCARKSGIPARKSTWDRFVEGLVNDQADGVDATDGAAVIVGSHPTQQMLQREYGCLVVSRSTRVVYVLDTELGECVASWSAGPDSGCPTAPGC